MWWLLLVGACVASAGEAKDFRLPLDTAPVHYNLRYVFDIQPESNFSYFAVVDILITALKPTSKIVLHAEDFSVSDKEISVLGDNAAIEVTQVELNDEFNFLTLHLGTSLMAGQNYTLTIPFYGNLLVGLHGAYISSYFDKETNEKEYLVTTQFEAIHARKAFPCYDEPAYKATFSIIIGHHRDFTAVSNMPLQNSSNENALSEYFQWDTVIGRKFNKAPQSLFVWDQFQTSVPMSTYLVAFVVSKFKSMDSPEGLSHVKFKIWARKDAIDQASYASVVGPKVLEHYEKWFSVPFPLPKQDMFAIPDFSAGAMENWGLITYRESSLMYDKDQSSMSNKERIAEVIAHELAHQWFGNLVTMKWWSDLWLNEGFATYMATIGMAAVEPSWKEDEAKAVENFELVANLDALESSHPVSVSLDDPHRISEIFDDISYKKGALLIRMMSRFLGEDNFRKALQSYLEKYSYKNAEQDQLWAELSLVARNVSVKDIMDTWTKQVGVPLLTVRRNYDEGSVTVTQQRYLVRSTSRSSSAWWIPLRVMCEREVSSGLEQRVQWLSNTEGISVARRFEHASAPDEWLLFNYDMMAPYRVNYDERNWELLTEAMSKPDAIPELGRVQLLLDSFDLAWANLLDYSTPLKLATSLQHETEYLPLYVGLQALQKIENVLKRTSDYGAYQKFVRKLIGDIYNKSGGLAVMKIVSPDDLMSVKLQTLISRTACRMKVLGCEENAMQLFQQWVDTPDPDTDNPIPVELRRTVYCVAISRGSVFHWRFLLARMQRANVVAARDAMQSGLTCSRDVWILKQLLEWSVTEGSDVRRQDAPAVFAGVVASPVGYYVARDFLYEKIATIKAAFKDSGHRVGHFAKRLITQFTKQSELDEFLAWKEKNSKYLEEGKLSIQQGIEKSQVNIEWVNKNMKDVVDQIRKLSA